MVLLFMVLLLHFDMMGMLLIMLVLILIADDETDQPGGDNVTLIV